MASTSIPPAIIPSLEGYGSDVVALGNDYRASRALWFACLAIQLYDHALTFDQEVAYLRSGSWGWGQIVYVMNRYWPIVDALFDCIALTVKGPSDVLYVGCCTFFFNWTVYAAAPIHISVGIILIQRIYVIYNCKKVVLYGLSALLAAHVTTETAMTGPVVAHLKPLKLPPPFSGCVPADPSPHIWAYWIPLLTFESTLFILAIVKVYEEARQEWNTPKILAVLLRDSLAYFGSVFAIILTNVLIWAIARPSLLALPIAPTIAAHSILGCRMLLNIHEAVKPAYGGHTSKFSTTFVMEELASPPDISQAHQRSAAFARFDSSNGEAEVSTPEAYT